MRGVRVDGRQADRSEVVREVVRGVVRAVLRAVAAALLVFGAPAKETEQADAAGGDAAEALDEQQRDLVVLLAERIVVVALEEGDVATAGGVAEGLRGKASLTAPVDGAAEGLLGVVRMLYDYLGTHWYACYMTTSVHTCTRPQSRCSRLSRARAV